MGSWTTPFKQPKLNLNQKNEDLQDSSTQNKRADDWKGTLIRIWRYLAKRKKGLYFVVLMVLISSILALAGPFVVGMSIDQVVYDGDTSGLFAVLILLAVIYLLHSLSVFLQHFVMVRVAQDTVYRLRTGLFHHLHKLPITFFDQRRHGELMSRVTNDMDNISNTLNSSVIQIFASVLTLVGTLTVMIYLSPLLTLISLVIVPMMYIGMKWITSRTGQLFKLQQRHLGELNGYVQESMSGQKIIKSFSQEERVIEGFTTRNQELRLAGFWAQTISGFIPKLMNMLNNFSFAIIAGIGGIFAYNGMITIGVIVIFAEYTRQFTRPLNDLANQFNTLLSAIAGAERVFRIMDEEDEISTESGKEDAGSITGEVIFKDVSFEYEGDQDTLSNISFTAKSGETTAIVGPTGAGKTTLISLLSRFYDPVEGIVEIDGRDMTAIKRESLRNEMAFVLQDSYLFQGTIRENIRYGQLTASDEDVVAAAKEANAHSFIMKFPDGYDTLIDGEGGGISQGQKQLLSIARALLRDPAILILDEATSSIDTVTEINIQEALKRLMNGRTSFVIAHRLNTIRQADQILVLHEGELLESGTHAELINRGGFYADLVQAQQEKQIV
ncbi:ABC transporter ATP-binding protein [Salisediminibacterium beveridgei]|uniref:Putative ABC transporter ATP-binding protein YfiC n=1 Tax=Salisediminibacterium beveridgei TaxID=632773 RepID=A0A1D7QXH7_9BACI|nr:ABC transporter ATP-binding protein [Salisediminibacterium beveridgei]AOM83721.1 putative ABC transporter ATP-binding protein YfiC [Salisediminibacterium beveridgei]